MEIGNAAIALAISGMLFGVFLALGTAWEDYWSRNPWVFDGRDGRCDGGEG